MDVWEFMDLLYFPKKKDKCMSPRYSMLTSLQPSSEITVGTRRTFLLFGISSLDLEHLQSDLHISLGPRLEVPWPTQHKATLRKRRLCL